MMKKQGLIKIGTLAAVVAMLAMNMSFVPMAQAAGLTTVADYLNRMVENQTSGTIHEFNLTPATAVSGGAGANVVNITFPDGDDGNWCRTAGTMTLSTASLRDSAIALPGTLVASCTQGSGAGSYDTISISGVNDLSAGTLYGVIISGNAGVLGTPANTTSGVIAVTTNDGTSNIDSASLAVDILTDDQITVSGRVEPTLAFAISDNAVGFGAITASAIRFATDDELGSASEPASNLPSQLTASTNADDGLVIEIRDTNAALGTGLYSSDTGTTLVSRASTAIAAGTEGYGVYGKNASSITLAEGFDNDSTGDAAISTSFQQFASTNAPVSNATVDVALNSAISNITPAGNYADVLTLLATGKF